jgi:hypothetical protein
VRRQRLVYSAGPRGMDALADDETLGGAGVARDGSAELDVLVADLTAAEAAELGSQVCHCLGKHARIIILIWRVSLSNKASFIQQNTSCWLRDCVLSFTIIIGFLIVLQLFVRHYRSFSLTSIRCDQLKEAAMNGSADAILALMAEGVNIDYKNTVRGLYLDSMCSARGWSGGCNELSFSNSNCITAPALLHVSFHFISFCHYLRVGQC